MERDLVNNQPDCGEDEDAYRYSDAENLSDKQRVSTTGWDEPSVGSLRERKTVWVRFFSLQRK